MRIKKPKKTFAERLNSYKRYDPKTEGFGSVSDWSMAFKERMGLPEATARVGGSDPLSLLGLASMPATLAELRKHYHKVMLKNQDCFRADATAELQEQARKLIAAFTVLEAKLS